MYMYYVRLGVYLAISGPWNVRLSVCVPVSVKIDQHLRIRRSGHRVAWIYLWFKMFCYLYDEKLLNVYKIIHHILFSFIVFILSLSSTLLFKSLVTYSILNYQLVRKWKFLFVNFSHKLLAFFKHAWVRSCNYWPVLKQSVPCARKERHGTNRAWTCDLLR